MNEDKVPITESISNFNIYSVEVRNRIDGLLKQVLIVSGGIQTITIGAFLSGKSPYLSDASIETLKLAWLSLSVSIICCLTLMLLQIVGMVHVGFRQQYKLENKLQGVEVMNTWLLLRVINWFVGLSAFGSCILGVYYMSKSAIQIIGAGGAV